MKTSTFLTALRDHAALPLNFRAGANGVVPAHYHLTEVKRVSYETMDCGAMKHRWAETHFELWAPTVAEPGRGSMAAGKFLQIVDRVQAELPLAGEVPARVLAAPGGGAAVLHGVDTVRVSGGQLWVELVPERARCKAAERRSAAGGAACCGAAPADAVASPEEAEAGCGCAPRAESRAEAACCA